MKHTKTTIVANTPKALMGINLLQVQERKATEDVKDVTNIYLAAIL